MTFRDIRDVSDMNEMLDAMPKFSDVGLKAARFGLDAMREVCRRIGSPHESFRSIHVAGTNGKGTTCRLLASTFMEAGLKTGLTTSPHLISVHERIRVNDDLITDDELLRFFRLHAKVLDEIPLTYFELTICIAFWHFAEQGVDIAVIETGLGGRLDATNIITPICSVITSIGFDHTDVLGGSLEEIAREKAGIIKSSIPVVVGDLPSEAMSEIRNTAGRCDSPLAMALDANMLRDGDQYRISYAGSDFQADASRHPAINTLNTSMMLACIQAISRVDGITLPGKAMVAGIERFFDHFPIQGHVQRIFSDREWYFDGAHNPQALDILRSELARKAPLSQWTVVFASMKDKLNPEVLQLFKGFGALYIMPMDSPRAASLEEIRAMYAEVVGASEHPEGFPSLRHLLDPGLLEADAGAGHSGLVIFTGSFYFYSKLMSWKQLHSPLP